MSGGYLAFAEQAGFLRAIEQSGLQVDAVCGTSSGALAGALWAAGMSAEQIFSRLTEKRPLRRVLPSRRPWRGLFSMRPIIHQLRRDLPSSFADLQTPLGVGVIDGTGSPFLLTQGPLPRSVAASCAIPHLFGPVWIGGEPWADGGVADRTAFKAWRRHRPESPILMHWVDSARPLEPEADTNSRVIRSPAAGASFLRLGDVRTRFERSRTLALSALDEAR